MTAVGIRLLGAVAVERDGVAESRRSRNHAALLAMLALHAGAAELARDDRLLPAAAILRRSPVQLITLTSLRKILLCTELAGRPAHDVGEWS